MISTITTSTVTSTVTSTTTSTTTITTMIGFGMALGLVAAVALLIFLCTKELAGVSPGRVQRSLSRFLDVPIFPLAIAFAMIVAMKIVEMLA